MKNHWINTYVLSMWFFFIMKSLKRMLARTQTSKILIRCQIRASEIKVHMSIINFCLHGFLVFFRLVTPTLDIEMKGKNSCWKYITFSSHRPRIQVNILLCLINASIMSPLVAMEPRATVRVKISYNLHWVIL